MAYVVLARKYRPQRFPDLIGQEHVTRTLANAIAHDRVHHAYLFCGGRGLGKTTTARLLAKCLVCVDGPTSDPCNVCRECVAVTEGRSVDVIEIDGASNNRVDDVRNLREQVRYLPQSARRKIYIIDEVHMLTGSAFNALLKTLEEPPEHVTFIFATTEVHELPATILSRVARFDFRRLASARLVEHMQSILRSEGLAIDEAGLFLIARAGGGSVRDALTLLDKVIAFADDGATSITADEVRMVLGVPSHLAVTAIAQAVLAHDAEATLREFDRVVASGQDLQRLAVAFLQHLRNLVVVKLTGSREVLLDASEAEFEALTAQAETLPPSVLSQLFDRFARVVDSLAHTRVPRLILEMGFLDLVHAEPLLPLGDLIDHLGRFAQGAPAVAPSRSATGSGAGSGASRASRAGGGSPRSLPEGGGGAQDFRSTQNAHAGQRGAAGPPMGSPDPSPSSPRDGANPAGGAPSRPAPGRPPASRGAGADDTSVFWDMINASGALAEGRSDGRTAGPPPQSQDPRSPAQHQHQPQGPRPQGERSREGRSASASDRGGEGETDEGPPAEPDLPPFAPIPGSSGAPQRSAERSTERSAEPPRERPDDAALAVADEACGTCPGAPRAAPAAAIPWETLAPFDAWEQLLERIAEEAPELSGALADAGLVSLEGGIIRLACPDDNHTRRGHVLADANKATFEELAHVHLGARFALVLAVGEPSLPELPSLTLVRSERRRALQAEVDAEARAHPSIRALLEAFEAEVQGVKPLLP